jgi:hypothetical protein
MIEKELRTALKSRFAADWSISLGGNRAFGRATIAPFTLEIEHSDRGSIGWIAIESRPGGGVRVWRSKNELDVPLSAVLDEMQWELRQIRNRLVDFLKPDE